MDSELVLNYKIYGEKKSQQFLHYHELIFQQKTVSTCIGIFEFFHCGLCLLILVFSVSWKAIT